jgi:antitoxin HicB
LNCLIWNVYTKTKKKRLREYTVFSEANEYGGYTLTVPALPGLVTEGKDLDHSRTMAKDAVLCCIEGLKKAKETIPVERESAQVKISVVALAVSKNPTLAKGARMGHPQIQRLAHPATAKSLERIGHRPNSLLSARMAHSSSVGIPQEQRKAYVSS